ncbi:nuclear pore complex protein Nup75-like [Ctenocephalides felis]|uniref:nuclear pore complex protein Nup75-like n=1 Tax=Ctenocephalides felis TaxID=7515 RepID=UPI000E6E5734|nr:nuclear pore complex protein Nup75-like [Ctenocephalides felis]
MDGPKTIVIPDPVCKSSGIVATWANPEILSVRAYQHITSSTKDTPSPYENKDIKIHHIRKTNILQDKILRKLVNESIGSFLSVQQVSNDNAQQKLVILSRQYRSIIRACLENLQEKVDNLSLNEEKRSEYQNYVTIFYSVECLWHLCEIILIDSVPGNIIVPQLLSWIRLHFHTHETTASHY